MRARRKTITFERPDGGFAGKVEIVETNVRPRGNAHYSRRRPDGPVCECGAPWQPVCSSSRCPGRTVPVAMMRSERRDRDTRRWQGGWDTPKAEPRTAAGMARRT